MKQMKILLAEDNEGDIILTTDAFEEAKTPVTLNVVRDGKEIIDYLTRSGEHADAEMPDLVMLDVNMPKKNGHEVLRFIKENEKLKHIPVIMFTTSNSDRDINLAYNNHVNCYISKPTDIKDYLKITDLIQNYWFSIVTLYRRKY